MLHFLSTAEKVGRVELRTVAVCVEVCGRRGGQWTPFSVPPYFNKCLNTFLADVLRKFVERHIYSAIASVGYNIVRCVVKHLRTFNSSVNGSYRYEAVAGVVGIVGSFQAETARTSTVKQAGERNVKIVFVLVR